MGLRFDTSLIHSVWALTRRWSLQIEAWEALAVRREFQNASLAIVGNAGYLSELPQGELIDGHDLVLRMNNFRTAGFESQVGGRTDIFLSTYCDDVNLQNAELRQVKWLISSMPYNVLRHRSLGVPHVHGAHLARGLRQLSRRQMFVPDWDLFLATKRELGKYPTTGAMAALLATRVLSRVCRSIYFTGFSFFQGKSHYFRDAQTVPRNHDMQREQQFIRELFEPFVAAGRIRLDGSMMAQLQLGATSTVRQPGALPE